MYRIEETDIIDELPPLDAPEAVLDTEPIIEVPDTPFMDRPEIGEAFPKAMPSEWVGTGHDASGAEKKDKKKVEVKLNAKVKDHQREAQVFDKNRDAAYEKEDKTYGDNSYKGAGHGKILIKQNADNVKDALLKDEYYQQGYTNVDKDDMGVEDVKGYGYDGSTRARKHEHEFIKGPEKKKREKRQKKKVIKAKKEKKKKVGRVYGSEEYPLKMAESGQRE